MSITVVLDARSFGTSCPRPADKPGCACAGKLSRQQEELINLTAEDAVERLCTGQVSATEYAEALLAQNQLNECLNNFAALQPQQVQQFWPPIRQASLLRPDLGY